MLCIRILCCMLDIAAVFACFLISQLCQSLCFSNTVYGVLLGRLLTVEVCREPADVTWNFRSHRRREI